jgi:hypothetical protein
LDTAPILARWLQHFDGNLDFQGKRMRAPQLRALNPKEESALLLDQALFLCSKNEGASTI